jgi:hypothetical protein
MTLKKSGPNSNNNNNKSDQTVESKLTKELHL